MTSYRRVRSRDLFPTDEPVPAASLVGRSVDVDELTNALANGLNRIMVRPRRTGKTSVALAAVAELRARGCYVASIDLFRLSGTAELAWADRGGAHQPRTSAPRRSRGPPGQPIADRGNRPDGLRDAVRGIRTRHRDRSHA